jgi:hypothetical protein
MLAQHEFELRRFTVDETLRMVEAGIIGEDEPVELLDGRLVLVNPQGSNIRAGRRTGVLARRPRQSCC